MGPSARTALLQLAPKYNQTQYQTTQASVCHRYKANAWWFGPAAFPK